MPDQRLKWKGRDIYAEEFDRPVLEYEAGKRRKEERDQAQGSSSPEQLLIIHMEPLSFSSPEADTASSAQSRANRDSKADPSFSIPSSSKANRSSLSSFAHKLKQRVTSKKIKNKEEEKSKPQRGIWEMYAGWDKDRVQERRSRREGICGFAEADCDQLKRDFGDVPTPPRKRQGKVIEGEDLKALLEGIHSQAQVEENDKLYKETSDMCAEKVTVEEIIDSYFREDCSVVVSEEENESPIDPMFKHL